MYQRYKDQVTFLAVYVREAHPTDGWRASGNDKAGISLAQPRTAEERQKAARQCCATLEITMPLVVDTLDDRVGHAYSGMPDRLYVIDRAGKVAYQGGRGPFGFKTGEMEQSLIMLLLEQGEKAKPAPGIPVLNRASRLLMPSNEAARAPSKNMARWPILDNARAWKLLPPAEKGAGKPLPVWARATAASLPSTTAAMLELDYRHRALSPLPPLMRGKIRWVAARASGCAYTQIQAEDDLRRAGLDDAGCAALNGDWAKLPDEERALLTFARQMTEVAHSVSDEQVKELIERHGEGEVVAMVLLLAYASFQDCLILALGITPAAQGPLPPLEVQFQKPAKLSPQPRRTMPSPAKVDTVNLDSEWTALKFEDLQQRMDEQRARKPRIRVPSWDEVRPKLPTGVKPAKPLRIRWSLVCAGYQPELANGWSACTRAFGQEAAMSRVFEESLFWVVTRAMTCFY
jgi:alkylhydroperoxidase family enzyme